MKLLLRWYLTSYSEGLQTYFYIFSLCPPHWRLVNQQRHIYDCVFRLFDSSKYLTTLRSNISRFQRATILILITLYNPLFHLWKSSKNLWALPYFCLGCLLKSASVTSFSQLRLSRNKPTFFRKINGKIVEFLSSVVYYFEDLLKSADMAFVQNKTFINL